MTRLVPTQFQYYHLEMRINFTLSGIKSNLENKFPLIEGIQNPKQVMV
jgi:hypothetical protein